MKLNHIKLLVSSSFLFSVSLAWGATGVVYKVVEIQVGKNKSPQVQIIDQLPSLAVDEANKSFAEAARNMGCVKGESSYKLKESKNSDSVLSFQVDYDYMCEGAAHPEEGTEGLNVDLKTGKKLTLSMLFKDFNKDRTAIAKKVFSTSSSDDDDCPNSDPADIANRLSENSFYLNEGSIVLIAKGPHANRSCDLTSSVFISKLQRFYAETSVLARIAKAHPEASCEGQYTDMKKKGELKKGLTLKQFTKLLCQ